MTHIVQCAVCGKRRASLFIIQNAHRGWTYSCGCNKWLTTHSIPISSFYDFPACLEAFTTAYNFDPNQHLSLAATLNQFFLASKDTSLKAKMKDSFQNIDN